MNKVNSKVILRWSPRESTSLPADVQARFLSRYGSRLTDVDELIITSEKSRDQPKNRLDCLAKLAAMIRAVAVAPKARKATKPSAGARRRRLAEKKERSQKKEGRRRPSLE